MWAWFSNFFLLVLGGPFQERQFDFRPGRDHLSQTELAVRTVQRARPDMTASDALAAVNLARRAANVAGT